MNDGESNRIPAPAAPTDPDRLVGTPADELIFPEDRLSSLMRNLLAFGALLVGLAAVGGGVWWFIQRKDAKVAEAYADLAAAKTPEQFAAVAQRHPGSPVEEEAVFRAAQVLFDDGEYEKAGSQFSVFLQKWPAGAFAARAKLGMACSLESRKLWDPAEKKYAELGADAEGRNAPLAADAYLAAGRCAEKQGSAAAAEKWYKAAVATGAANGSTAQAVDALARLGAAKKSK